MATLFKLPLLGQTMQEGTIVRWHKSEGESVEAWETLLEVMTDKASMEVEPAVSGVVRKLLAAEGDTVPVGAPVAIIAAADEPIEHLLAESGIPVEDGKPAETPDARRHTPAPQRPGRSAEAMDRPPPRPSAQHGSEATPEPPNVSPRARERAREAGIDWRTLSIGGTGFEGMIVERDIEAFLARQPATPRVTPLAARLASETGVDLSGITGTGPGGKVTADDVRAASERRQRAAPRATPAGWDLDRSPREVRLTGIRKIVADRLTAAYQSAPHVPLRVEIDMTDAAAFRAQLLPEVERRAGVRLTFTDLIAAAVVVALADHPRLNATLEGDLLRLYPSVHLGLAVALEDGLVVPVIRDADLLPLPDLGAQARDLAERARHSALKPDELTGGTFTITNLGSYGIDSFDPILNPPQVAILGVGRIAGRVVPHGDGTAVRQMMTATLVFDHRALDGAPAAQFAARLKELLEAPYRLLL
jgi:pyruvate dehydrogenase E2 component (dihydrolipoamide acetyltransferase)